MFTYKLSYWERESFLKNIDVVIIGSGIVGLNAAIHLKKQRPKMEVAIFERGMLPAGASTRNAGFACFGSMTELLDDTRQMGEDAMLAVVEKRWRGLQALRSLVGDERLDFQLKGGYEMFTDDDEDAYLYCLERMDDLNRKIGAITGAPEVYKTADHTRSQFGFHGVQHLLINQQEGQVHTGKMMKALLDIQRCGNYRDGRQQPGRGNPNGVRLDVARAARPRGS
jgi:glycine/D-amino acid oxidase-like deaminating enzyme